MNRKTVATSIGSAIAVVVAAAAPSIIDAIKDYRAAVAKTEEVTKGAEPRDRMMAVFACKIRALEKHASSGTPIDPGGCYDLLWPKPKEESR
jgi:hypothetical protein